MAGPEPVLTILLLDACEPVVTVLAELGSKHQVDFVLSLSADPEDIPVFFRQYLI